MGILVNKKIAEREAFLSAQVSVLTDLKTIDANKLLAEDIKYQLAIEQAKKQEADFQLRKLAAFDTFELAARNKITTAEAAFVKAQMDTGRERIALVEEWVDKEQEEMSVFDESIKVVVPDPVEKVIEVINDITGKTVLIDNPVILIDENDVDTAIEKVV